MKKLLTLLRLCGIGVFGLFIRWKMARNSKRYFREKAAREKLFGADYREWIRQTMTTDEPEPFCLIDGSYCNSAYTDCCYGCEDAKTEWERRTLHRGKV